TVTASAQSAEKIVKQAAKALGGEKALRNVKSWRVIGTIANLQTGESGSFQAAAQLPNLYTISYDLRGLEVSAGYNGKSAWVRDSRTGLQTLTGAESRDFQVEARWRNTRWLDYKQDKSKLVFAGKTEIGEKAANSVILTTVKNVKIKMYFAAESGLLLRDEVPAGAVSRICDYSDYRPVDGVMEPHAISVAVGDEHYEIKLDRVEHNPLLDRSLFDFPKISNEPLPDVRALIEEVSRNEEEIDRILENYTYNESITRRSLDSKGQLREMETETRELTFYKGNHIRRLIAKNGKPLTAEQEADENKRIEKLIRNIEKKEAEKEKKKKDNPEEEDFENNKRPTAADILRASKLINPRRERFRNRDVIVFDYEPLPGYKPQKDYEKLFGKMAGALWVDLADKQVARVEARLVEPYKIGGGLVASVKPGGSFVLEQDRVNNEIWLPTRADLNLGIKVFLVKGFDINMEIGFGNYRRFNVEAEKEKLKDPAEKPSKP
ncbi:MAG: hypothetical protein J2P41_04440, partial [Blastocatellia bacterium]|nr:hypothetical protein [Blastocatellia bacterium]